MMQRSRQLYLIAAIVLLGFLFLVGTTFLWPITSAFAPKEEPITELYMSAMPHTTSGTTDFTFTIHNLMGKDLAYTYVVYVKGSKNEYAVLDNSSTTVASGETANITESVTVPYRGATLYVELPQLAQQIHVALKTL